jgi:hypothetical protein
VALTPVLPARGELYGEAASALGGGEVRPQLISSRRAERSKGSGLIARRVRRWKRNAQSAVRWRAQTASARRIDTAQDFKRWPVQTLGELDGHPA